MPPAIGLKFMAPSSHISPQVRQTTPLWVMHDSSIDAFRVQGMLFSQSETKMGSLQAVTQSPQNSHSPVEKLICGKPPRPRSNILVGQMLIQRSQRLQSSTNCCSAIVQGALTVFLEPLSKFPRRNCIREIKMSLLNNFLHKIRICGEQGSSSTY